MNCRSKCGACCIALSISSPLPGMPEGKPAGVKCIHLTTDLRCSIFTDPERPRVCADFMPEKSICGDSQQEAIEIMTSLEKSCRQG